MAHHLHELRRRVRVLEREMIISTKVGRKLLAHYPYSFTPEQLWTLCNLFDETLDVDGIAIEVGCARGDTTIFLNRHAKERGLQRPYVCLDTFSGFTDDDIAEERRRGHSEEYDDFDINSEAWFRAMIHHNELGNRVTVIKADAATFAFDSLPPIAFGLIDVDLYRPMSAALRRCYERLAPGGVLVADDCKPYANKWDGAMQAYLELSEALGRAPEVRLERLGVVRKPRVEADAGSLRVVG